MNRLYSSVPFRLYEPVAHYIDIFTDVGIEFFRVMVKRNAFSAIDRYMAHFDMKHAAEITEVLCRSGHKSIVAKHLDHLRITKRQLRRL